MTSRELIDYLNENYILFGTTLTSSEGCLLSVALCATTFPFIGLLSCEPRPIIHKIIEGVETENPTALLQQLQDFAVERQAAIDAIREQQHEREESARARQQQQREFEHALNVDRQRVCLLLNFTFIVLFLFDFIVSD